MYKLEIEPSETLHTKFGNVRLSRKGYYYVSSSKEGNNNKFWHRLIFEDFYGEIPPNHFIHHKNGNSMDNCILNLQIMHKSNHSLHHTTNGNHPTKDKKLSLSACKNMSQHKNTTGYFRVFKHKDKSCSQGFIYTYMYYDKEDGKRKAIRRVKIEDLEKAVKEKGLEWKKFGDDL